MRYRCSLKFTGFLGSFCFGRKRLVPFRRNEPGCQKDSKADKDKIEKAIEELLALGHIRPSSSPFAFVICW